MKEGLLHPESIESGSAAVLFLQERGGIYVKRGDEEDQDRQC
jgi:hypothetical protein